MDSDQHPSLRTVDLVGDDSRVRLLDQTRLPGQEVYVDLCSPEEVAEAISALRVRGAPAIGIAAAYGVALGFATDTSSLRPGSSR